MSRAARERERERERERGFRCLKIDTQFRPSDAISSLSSVTALDNTELNELLPYLGHSYRGTWCSNRPVGLAIPDGGTDAAAVLFPHRPQL